MPSKTYLLVGVFFHQKSWNPTERNLRHNFWYTFFRNVSSWRGEKSHQKNPWYAVRSPPKTSETLLVFLVAFRKRINPRSSSSCLMVRNSNTSSCLGDFCREGWRLLETDIFYTFFLMAIIFSYALHFLWRFPDDIDDQNLYTHFCLKPQTKYVKSPPYFFQAVKGMPEVLLIWVIETSRERVRVILPGEVRKIIAKVPKKKEDMTGYVIVPRIQEISNRTHWTDP